MKYFTILFFTIVGILFTINSIGQNFITHTINNSGGYSNNFEWSLGESTSIKYFIAYWT